MNNKKNKLNKWVISVSLGITVLGLGLLFVADRLDNPYHEWLKHLGFVLIPLGTIELIFHFAFTSSFINEIIEHLGPDLKNTLNESLKSDLIPEFNKTLGEEINKGHEVVYDAGIIGCKRSMKFDDFLNSAIDYFRMNSTNGDVERTIRIYCTYIDDLRPSNNRRQYIEEQIHRLIVMLNCKFLILLPDSENYNMQFELWLRNKSANFGNNNPNQRLEKLRETITELEKLRGSYKAQIEIRYFSNFISSPLLSYDNIWYQGNYLNDITAEDNYYIKAKSFSDEKLGLANRWKYHFVNVWNASDRFEKAFDHAGGYLNSISCSNLSNEDNRLFEEGKQYKIITHSLYTNTDKAQTKNHYLSQWNIKVENQRDGCFNVTLTTKTYSSNNRELKVDIYSGVCTFDKSGSNNTANNILFIFGKDIVKNEFVDPIIMSGKIRRDEKDKPEDVLLLHITYFSEHYKNRVSKIGILELSPHQENELNPIEINKEFIKSVDSNPIYLLLLRKHKVIMQSLYTSDGEVVNSTKKIQHWLNQKYKDLKVQTDKKSNRSGEYILYYKVVNKPDSYESCEINILSNGIIILNRTNASKENETYYGEINTRAKGSSKDGVVFVKFIRTIQSDNIDHQDYNEIFMLLHWSKIGKEFSYTRGIILGQRDEGLIFNEGLPVIEADRCIICRPDFTKVSGSRQEILRLLNPDMDNTSNTITVKFEEEDEQQTINKDTKGTLIVQFDKNHCN